MKGIVAIVYAFAIFNCLLYWRILGEGLQ